MVLLSPAGVGPYSSKVQSCLVGITIGTTIGIALGTSRGTIHSTYLFFKTKKLP